MKTRLCPKCRVEMQTTYEPYELRCTSCGFWFDTYTGKPITIPKREPQVVMFEGVEYKITGHRLGLTVEMCHKPRMTVLIVGYNREKQRWLGSYIFPTWADRLVVLSEQFLNYVQDEGS